MFGALFFVCMSFAESTLKILLTFPWQQDANKAGGTSIPFFGLFTFPPCACINSITKFEKFAFPLARRHSRSRQISPCRPLTIYLICVCGAATLQSRLILFYETCLIAVMLRYLRQGPIERPEMHSLAGESRGTAFSLSLSRQTLSRAHIRSEQCNRGVVSFSLFQLKRRENNPLEMRAQCSSSCIYEKRKQTKGI